MSGWRPELTAATADTEALHQGGLRVVPPPAVHCACPSAGRLLARSHPAPVRGRPRGDPALARRHVRAGRDDRAARGHRPDLAAGAAGAGHDAVVARDLRRLPALRGPGPGDRAQELRRGVDALQRAARRLAGAARARPGPEEGLRRVHLLARRGVHLPRPGDRARAHAARRRPHVAVPERHAGPAHADRGRRRHRPPARAQARHPSRVRAGAGRLRRRRARPRTSSAPPPT